jgi:VanZ family protein
MKGSTALERLIRRWLPPLVWMGVIFFFSAQPTVPSVPGRWDLLLKKSMHMVAYGMLTWLYLRALRGDESRESRSDDAATRAVSAGMALLYALSDEYHQTFVPGRNGSLVDVAIDAVGVGGAIALDWWLRSARRPGAEETAG